MIKLYSLNPLPKRLITQYTAVKRTPEQEFTICTNQNETFSLQRVTTISLTKEMSMQI